MSKVVVSSDFCFDPTHLLTTAISNKALRLYTEGFDEARNLEGDLPILLDTNILLGYYGMSQIEKQKLVQFFKSYKERIYITPQVEQEYLRNRLSVIKKDFFTPLQRISDDFISMRADVLGKLQSYGDGKKNILSQDYPEVWEGLKRIQEEIKTVLMDNKLFEEIVNQVAVTTQINQNIVFLDDLLELVASFQKTEGLSDIEQEFIKGHFTELLKNHSDAKETAKPRITIPGCGENKDDATGDFIIFHEILKFMKNDETSCIFLTNDVTKGDWLQSDKNPHIHYIEQTYLRTEKTMFIIHAERTLTNISFENIHKTEEIEKLSVDEALETSFESTIVTLERSKGYGFIFSPNGNLYFHRSDVHGDFTELSKNDVVSFSISKNSENQEVAKHIRKLIYSFENPFLEISTSQISYINKLRGIGFISHQPENLYFHEAFMGEGEFEKLNVGDAVDFIVGLNPEGENIARVVRKRED